MKKKQKPVEEKPQAKKFSTKKGNPMYAGTSAGALPVVGFGAYKRDDTKK